VDKAQRIHGAKYDYSQVKYKQSKLPVTIICKIHGIFSQTPSTHLARKGCPKCSTPGQKRSNTLFFVQKARKVHGGTFDYSKVNYQTSTDEVTIICPRHGEFTQRASKHLEGSGCFRCQYDKKRLKTEEFIVRASGVHKNKYDYSQSRYVSTHRKIAIKCLKHGLFYQTPSNHINGRGCPVCKLDRWRTNFKSSQSVAILYLVKINGGNESFLKLGKTQGTVKQRVRYIANRHYKVALVYEVTGTFEEISKAEIAALQKFSHLKYTPTHAFSGKTECFQNDALLTLCEYMDDL